MNYNTKIKNANYFSISVYYTPDISKTSYNLELIGGFDISHVDKLTVIVRYLKYDSIVDRISTSVKIHSILS